MKYNVYYVYSLRYALSKIVDSKRRLLVSCNLTLLASLPVLSTGLDFGGLARRCDRPRLPLGSFLKKLPKNANNLANIANFENMKKSL